MNRVHIFGALALAAVVSGCSDSSNSIPVPDINFPPSISAGSDATVEANSAATPFDFTVDDDATAPGSLALAVTSDNAALFEGGELAIEGSGGTRTLLVTPAAASTGSATITLTVTDAEGLSASSAFLLTVSPQQAAFSSSVRSVFSRGENDEPVTINDKEFNDDASDYNDLVGS